MNRSPLADDSPSTPARYTGPRDLVHSHRGRPFIRWNHDTDRSGDHLYAYNSLGYRGPEYAPQARFVAFVFGESDAFGLGVDFDDIWAVRVARAEAARRGIPPSDVCVMNFAESGASNAYIARSVVTQCGRIEPDLALVQFAKDQRVELIDERAGWSGGPWFRDAAVDEQIDASHHDERKKRRLRAIVARGRDYLDYCTPIQGLYQSLRDVLLVQETLAGRAGRAVAIMDDVERIDALAVVDDGRLAPLVDAIDDRFLCRLSFDGVRDLHAPLEDTDHLGAAAHAAIADEVAEHLERGRIGDGSAAATA